MEGQEELNMRSFRETMQKVSWVIGIGAVIIILWVAAYSSCVNCSVATCRRSGMEAIMVESDWIYPKIGCISPSEDVFIEMPAT